MGKEYKSSAATRRAISEALKALMLQKPLDKITIGEIMDACGMRRQHFYYYFTDIYDLLRWTFEEEALQLRREQSGALPWQEGLLQLFHYIADHRAICLCALDSLGREYLNQLFETDISGIVRRTVDRLARENGFPENAAMEDTAVRFLTLALAGVMESWLRGELTQTPEELIGIFSTIFQDYIRGVKLRPSGAEGAAQ